MARRFQWAWPPRCPGWHFLTQHPQGRKASLAPLLTLASDSFKSKWNGTVCRLQGTEERGHLIFFNHLVATFFTLWIWSEELSHDGSCHWTASGSERTETPTHPPGLYLDVTFTEKPSMTSYLPSALTALTLLSQNCLFPYLWSHWTVTSFRASMDAGSLVVFPSSPGLCIGCVQWVFSE